MKPLFKHHLEAAVKLMNTLMPHAKIHILCKMETTSKRL